MIPIWPKVPLKTIYKGFYDGPHATPAESDEGAIFLGIKNVTESGRLDLSEIRYIAESDLGKWTKRVIPQKDDIVFSYEATLHRYGRIPEGFRGCLGRRMALIRVNQEIANIDFVFCYFLGPIWRCEVEKNILNGATVDRIPLTNVPDFGVYLPPLIVQKKIAAILSAYDDLIENNLKRINLLEEMAQITYEEWFVRLKFPGHETASMDSETGLPVGWYEAEITAISFINANSIKTKDAPETIKYIDIASADTGFYQEPEAMSFAEAPSRARRKVNFGDTIFSTVRPNRKTYSLILEDDSMLVASTGFAVLTPKIEGTFPFVYLTVANQAFVDRAVAVAGGAAYPAINQNDFEKIKILKSDDALIKLFSEKVINNFVAKHTLAKQNQLLKEARDILLPRLMTGMIDVEQLPVAQLDIQCL